ncbi:MAG TPA: pyridoxal phosphate-dependent aminotransferase [Candidatus Krumholzibacteria bacterium]|nr:pyridoxal phosphate-dependent aminotransferase [Candidatus Krumholzibacteria bacterium]
MPRYPDFAGRSARITGSVYEKFKPRMAAQGDNLVKLHIGDSYALPPYPLPVDAAFFAAHPGVNRYCDTFGIASLRAALAEKVRKDNRIDVQPENILMTCGATNALAATIQALVDPGDDVMILAPHWPFFRGMVRAAGGGVIDVPFYTVLDENPGADIGNLLERSMTKETVAIYLNSPNNPSGKVLTREQLAAVAGFARAHHLWLISDEAYDGMTYGGREHISPASFHDTLERSVSVFTFSKVYMFAGLRLGYAVASADAIHAINKAMVHQLYSPSTLAQEMMIDPVRTRGTWSKRFVQEYEATRDRVAKALRFDAPLPDGAYYFFFNAEKYLRGRSITDVVNACLDAGVSVAPGEDFGASYGNWLRICFAGESPERVMLGVERLNGVLAGG